MTAEELMTIANMGKGTDMSSYEHFMMAEKSARRPSGVGIAGRRMDFRWCLCQLTEQGQPTCY